MCVCEFGSHGRASISFELFESYHIIPVYESKPSAFVFGIWYLELGSWWLIDRIGKVECRVCIDSGRVESRWKFKEKKKKKRPR
jgi:hypothetical protein